MAAQLETNARAELHSKAAALAARYDGRDTLDVLEAAIKTEFPDQICLVSSFGADSAVLLKLVSLVDTELPVIFLDTHKHFPETLEYRTMLTRQLGLKNCISVTPNADALAADDPTGRLHADNPDLCCHLRKTLPMLRALNPYKCWITGRKQYQSDDRESLHLFDAQDRWIKLNPLFDWSAAQVAEFRDEEKLPAHPLVKSGYLSIGCAPCTRAVRPGEDARAGRWADQDKTECGIHFEQGRTVRGG